MMMIMLCCDLSAEGFHVFRQYSAFLVCCFIYTSVPIKGGFLSKNSQEF